MALEQPELTKTLQPGLVSGGVGVTSYPFHEGVCPGMGSHPLPSSERESTLGQEEMAS